MSDEDRRKLERKAQDDALLAGRLATMNRRLGAAPALVPVVISARDPQRNPMRPPEVRAWGIVSSSLPGGVILDETAEFVSNWRGSEPLTVRLERGEVFDLDLVTYRIHVPDWFLDGGSA